MCILFEQKHCQTPQQQQQQQKSPPSVMSFTQLNIWLSRAQSATISQLGVEFGKVNPSLPNIADACLVKFTPLYCHLVGLVVSFSTNKLHYLATRLNSLIIQVD